MYLTAIKYGLPIVVILALAWYIHHKGYEAGLAHGKTLEIKALAEQQTALEGQCNKDKQLTNNIGTQYENNLSNADTDFDTYSLHDKQTGISTVTVAREASGDNGKAPSPINAKGNELPVEPFRKYARKAERYRLQLIGCQDFINEVWTAKNHN